LIALALLTKLLLKAKRVQEYGSEVEAPNVGVSGMVSITPFLY
jgi:hypothetical protein